MGASYEMELLDRWRLLADRQLIKLRLREQRVLSLLAVQGPVSRRRMAGMLWPDSTEARAADSLRVSLCHIHQQCAGVIRCDDGWVEIDPAVGIDLHRLRHRLQQVLLAPSAQSTPEDFFLRIRQLLPDWDEPWLFEEQEALRQLQLRALEARSLQLLNLGLQEQAWQLAQNALRLDPMRESAASLSARAESGQGNNASATAGLLQFIGRLKSELGVEPSPELLHTLTQLRGA